jgi:hypothetical protein
MSDIEPKIKEFLEKGEDWEKYPTTIEGVNIVRMPPTKTRPALLSVEVNPLRDGKPMKRRGLFVTSAEMLLSFGEILTEESLLNLMKTIDDINDEVRPTTKSKKPLKLD